ncbi:MAG: TrkH family potassium uptake protein [Pirellulaceae bacterium]
MNVRLTLKVLGGLMVFLGVMLATPIPFSFWFRPQNAFHDGALWAFVVSSLITLVIGGATYHLAHAVGDMTHREGFAVVTFGWVGYAIFGSLPYLLIDVPGISTPIDAFFEAMSGFSTTGASVVTALETVPKSMLFWRSLTQWLGGMGIIVLSLAILPFLGVGGMQLFEAEVPGPTKDRLTPRIQDTARVLWGVYSLLTAAEIALLWASGMDLFESLCHAMTTLATGGFSTRDTSLAAYSTATQLVVIVFMFIAGMNFALHYHALLGRHVNQYWRSEEFRFYVGVLGSAILVITLLVANDSTIPGNLLIKLRDATFQATSLASSTGYVTTDFELWPALAQYILITLMLICACAGSTSGGIKMVRILLVLKFGFLQISQLIHPREVRALKLDHRPVSRDVIQGVLSFFVLYMTVFLAGSFLMASVLPPSPHGGSDLLTAVTSVITTMGNVGPAMGIAGPTETYTSIPMAGKLVLSLCMLVGRLELFTVLVLFFPSFWNK